MNFPDPQDITYRIASFAARNGRLYWFTQTRSWVDEIIDLTSYKTEENIGYKVKLTNGWKFKDLPNADVKVFDSIVEMERETRGDCLYWVDDPEYADWKNIEVHDD